MRRSSNPDMPFPGAAPPTDATAKRGLVVGAFAECYLFGAVVEMHDNSLTVRPPRPEFTCSRAN